MVDMLHLMKMQLHTDEIQKRRRTKYRGNSRNSSSHLGRMRQQYIEAMIFPTLYCIADDDRNVDLIKQLSEKVSFH